MKNNLNEDDQKKFVSFLNYVAKYAKFTVNTEELIEYFKLLSHMQTILVPKIRDNILEVVRVVEAEEKTEINPTPTPSDGDLVDKE